MSRRVVTGLDSAGKSCIMIDEPMPAQGKVRPGWLTSGVPADNTELPALDVEWGLDLMQSGTTTFIICCLAPGEGASLHATNTIDYITMISGEITIGTETGEATLRAGDICVDRGILHSWINRGSEDAVYSVVTIPAHPVGAGRVDPS